MRRTTRIARASFLGLALTYAGFVHAGPTDTPLPTFTGGGSAVHVYTAVGVIKNNNLQTAFICTNLDTVAINIGVEVFDKNGVLANTFFPAPVTCPTPLGVGGGGETLGVPIGATVTVATGRISVLTEDVAMRCVPSLRNGSGRVIATTKNVSCTAIVVDDLHTIQDPADPDLALAAQPPPTAVNLPLIRVP